MIVRELNGRMKLERKKIEMQRTPCQDQWPAACQKYQVNRINCKEGSSPQ